MAAELDLANMRLKCSALVAKLSLIMKEEQDTAIRFAALSGLVTIMCHAEGVTLAQFTEALTDGHNQRQRH